MKEDFLHYVWQFQYFNKIDLKTTRGELVQVFQQGNLNSDAGADFQNAKLRIGEIDWAGSVEIHINSSDWEKHGHSADKSYENVILHVVWEDDKPVSRKDGSEIATLELKERVSFLLLEKYKLLMEDSGEPIPCANQFPTISPITKISMLDKSLMQRLERKASEVLQLHSNHQSDWEEIAYQWIGQFFGFKVNNQPFLQLTQAIPLKILQKHGDNLLQIEALIFGQSGFLDELELEDDYVKNLQREYKFLAHKYRLKESKLELSQWKFLRLRPANFPTIRLAQLAMLIYQHKSFFSKLIFTEDVKKLQKVFEIKQSDYWLKHYKFGKESAKPFSGLGKSSQINLLINATAPLLVAYGKYKGNENFVERAISLLEQLPAESNRITKVWKSLDLEIKTAFDSQASIELYNNFCQQKKCLQCNVGVKLVR